MKRLLLLQLLLLFACEKKELDLDYYKLKKPVEVIDVNTGEKIIMF